ncbi:hypothetical protein L210DRAFT_3442085 [Boletus edulis BED1]|uniref:Fork-head domain-containing protein n=1 Tax=Boletus edulis BED1 TaxID=1328754 RepID=A0AAD4GIC7_BOLED|nr:hypothetical protein L210DRAFT_3442085 [Boletus edulis BED1]
MSSIQNLLNPEARISSSCGSTERKWEGPISPESTSDTSTNAMAERSPPVSGKAQYSDHEPHPNCPDTLSCLPDTDGRPQHTLPVILRCAILGSVKKRLTIRDIYAAMEDKYAYFRNAGPTWKQSVRHHLSLNRLFERQPRPVTDPGFGSYWTVNLSAPPGTKRPRKRGRTSKAVSGPSQTDLAQSDQQKKRGRPRKPLSQRGTSAVPSTLSSPPPLVQGAISSMRTYDHDSEEHTERQGTSHDCNDSEDEYESEEDMVMPRNHDPSASGLDVLGIHEAASRLYTSDRSHRVYSMADKGVIDRMQMEMAGLRRQAADAISVSLRISDQLSEAQAEAARTKAALRATENLLEEEGRKRRETERVAGEENRLRRVAEETIFRLQNQMA